MKLVLCKELTLRNIAYKRQVLIPIIYKKCSLNYDLKSDISVEDLIVVELKSVETMHPVFKAQLLSHLKLTNKKSGLLINFNVPKLIEGFKRIIN